MMSSCLFLLLLVLEHVAASPRQFHFVNEPKNWTAAQAHCRSAYRDLASLGDREEMASMMASASAVWHDVSSSSAWIGLYDDIEDGWHWSLAQDGFYGDGEREFRNWQKGEPDYRRGAENCTEFRLSVWRDKTCSIGRQFICFDEGSGAEKLVLVKKRLDWRGAQAYCRENHTDLASVRSQAENEAIRALVGRPRVWIGLSRQPWRWSDGRDSTFRSWAHQQPNNRRGEEHCVEIRLKSSTWNDAPCGAQRPFFCYSEIESTTVPPSTVGMANAVTRVTDIPTSTQGVTEPWSEHVTQIQTATEQAATVGTVSETTVAEHKSTEMTTLVETIIQPTTFNPKTAELLTTAKSTTEFETAKHTTTQPTDHMNTAQQKTTDHIPLEQETTDHMAAEETTTDPMTTVQKTTDHIAVEQETTDHMPTAQKTTDHIVEEQETTDQTTDHTTLLTSPVVVGRGTTEHSYSLSGTTEHSTSMYTTLHEALTEYSSTLYRNTEPDPAEGGHTQHLTEDNLVLIRENRTWLEAVMFCRQHHVDLVSVPTLAVQSLVAAAARGASTPHVWLGLRYTCVLDLWFWLSPEGGCYSNWAPGKGPQGMAQCGVTGALESDGGQRWVSLPETQRLNFICSTCGKSTQ